MANSTTGDVAARRVFLSHAVEDKNEIQALRKALSDRGIGAWEDVLELPVGERLEVIQQRVAECGAFVLLLTTKSIGHPWIMKEVQAAREAKRRRPGYVVVPLIRGLHRSALDLYFPDGELVSLCLDDMRIEEAAGAIVQALGEAVANLTPRPDPIPAPAMSDLVVEIIDPRIDETGGTRRGAGRVRLVYKPAGDAREQVGDRVDFVAPFGPVEAEDLRWYLESYFGWPFGVFRARAQRTETDLPLWGALLFETLVASNGNASAMQAWRDAVAMPSGERVERRITILIEDAGASVEAAAMLLGLPWELLCDDVGYLFEGGLGARVRRKLPSAKAMPAMEPRLPLRILVVLARPEEEGVGFLDPRASTVPLAEALEELSTDVDLVVLKDGTLAALREALVSAETEGRPFQVVHFDGHGVYDRMRGLGQLCFEEPGDGSQRKAHLVDAHDLGPMLRERRVALFFLEACQTAMTKVDVTSSVAGELLKAGVASVVAMSHSVLVETARRFVHAFYGALAKGERIGTAMVRGQQFLKDDSKRGEHLALHDWFVPVLFQEDADARLFPRGIDLRPASIADRKRAATVRMGKLPEPPKHTFVGRARELLAIDRVLRSKRHLSIQGAGGQGKTALAIETARWLVAMRRFERVAFASVEVISEARAVIDVLGAQLVPGYSVAEREGLGSETERRERALLPIKQVLQERRVLLVIDNLETVLPAVGEAPSELAKDLLLLFRELSQEGATRLILTTREAVPAPLDGSVMRLGALTKHEAKQLLVAVLRESGKEPTATDADHDERLDALIDAVGGHARSLVLLAPMVVEKGLAVTGAEVQAVMAELEAKYPDERERSLIASVKLSLAKLDPKLRAKLGGLALFHGPTTVANIAHVLQVKLEEAWTISRQLVAVGMAEIDERYLLPDPGLAAALAGELAPADRKAAEERWFEATIDLVRFLYQQQSQDARIARHGARTALPDLLAALAVFEREVTADASKAVAAVGYATLLEQLVSNLGLPRVLKRIGEARRASAERLPEWSHAQFVAESEEVDRKLEAGDLRGALAGALSVRERAEAAGDAYPGAAYDRAMAAARLGRMLQKGGAAAEALAPLREAQEGFARLAASGDKDAAQMESKCITERGDALTNLGRLDEAAAAYEESAKRLSDLGDNRSVAVTRIQLGTVRLLQRRFDDALAAYREALATFEGFGEPAAVAMTWHQIGAVHETTGSFEGAEQAYRKSLAIQSARGDRSGEAATLHQLGILYKNAGRLEDAVAFYQQSIERKRELGNVHRESVSLSNLAIVFHKLRRFEEAREAIVAAIEAKKPYGHAAEPWKTHAILADLERDAGHPEAARKARAQAIATYRAYRDDGGEPTDEATQVVRAFGQALHASGPDAARAMLPDPTRVGDQFAPTLRALQALADGSRDPALAEDPAHHPTLAVELALLLESLSAP